MNSENHRMARYYVMYNVHSQLKATVSLGWVIEQRKLMNDGLLNGENDKISNKYIDKGNRERKQQNAS
jgi:hypothetical protein